MLPALLILVGIFVLLLAARIGAARRSEVLKRWPALVLGAAAVFALTRGAVWPAVGLGTLAAAAWVFWPQMRSPPPARTPSPSRAELEASVVLGVSPDATETEIRRAYREKMARAHPDRGGRHADAARLTAARDLLLKKRK